MSASGVRQPCWSLASRTIRGAMRQVLTASCKAHQIPLKVSVSVYEFGPFRLEPEERQLGRDGRLVAPPRKAFDPLHLLVGSGGRTISKDELMERLWPDVTVSEATHAQHIFAVRKA